VDFLPPFLQWWFGAIVWAIANVVYVDLRRKGERGFGRFASFFAGMPLTWIWLCTIREGRAPRITPPPDDEDRLLREIRVDRELRERWDPAPLPDARDETDRPPGS